MEVQYQVEGAIQWQQVIKKLMLYAGNYARKKVKKLADVGDVISGGVSASDLMCQVITGFLEGNIPPDPAKPFTEEYLMNLLKKAYRQDLLDLLKKSSTKTTGYAEEIKRFSKEGDKIDESFFSTYNTEKIHGIEEHQILRDPEPDAEERLEREVDIQELYDRAAGDQEVQEMIKAICEGDCETPREIASYLKTSVRDINNRQKRMRRIYQELQQAYCERKKAV